MTATLYARMNHANRESETCPALEILAAAASGLQILLPVVCSAAAAVVCLLPCTNISLLNSASGRHRVQSEVAYGASTSTSDISSPAGPFLQAATRSTISPRISARGSLDVSRTISLNPSMPSMSPFALKHSVKPSE